MSSVVVSGDTSGAVTLSAPAISGTTTLTLPSQAGLTSTMLLPGMQFYALNSAYAGLNATGAQSIFGVGVTLASSTVYAFEMVVQLAKTTGTTGHTIGFGFGGTATLNNIVWQFNGGFNTGTIAQGTATPLTTGYLTTASNTVVTGSSANATVYYWSIFKGTVSVNAGGTFIPQYTLSAAPGGAFSTVAGSYVSIFPLAASGSNVSIGTWS